MGMGAVRALSCRRGGPKREPGPDRRALSLRPDRLGGPVLDGVARAGVRLLADEHRPDGRRALQARGRVHDVAGHHRLAVLRSSVQRDDRLARVHGDPYLEPFLLGPVADGECGADGALGVVAVGRRRAEHAHHRVADELLDGPAVTFEVRADMLVVRREEGSHVLRVELSLRAT